MWTTIEASPAYKKCLTLGKRCCGWFLAESKFEHYFKIIVRVSVSSVAGTVLLVILSYVDLRGMDIVHSFFAGIGARVPGAKPVLDWVEKWADVVVALVTIVFSVFLPVREIWNITRELPKAEVAKGEAK